MRTYQSFYCRRKRRPTSEGRKKSRALQALSKADPPSQPAVRKSVRFEIEDSGDAEEQLVQAESGSLNAISEEDEAAVSLDLTKDKITEDKNIDPKFPPEIATNEDSSDRAFIKDDTNPTIVAKLPASPPPMLFIPKYSVGNCVDVYFPPGPCGKWTSAVVTKVNIKGAAYTVTYADGKKDWGVKEENMRHKSSNKGTQNVKENQGDKFLSSPLFYRSRLQQSEWNTQMKSEKNTQKLLALRSDIEHLKARRDERRSEVRSLREQFPTKATEEAVITLRKAASVTKLWIANPKLSHLERVRASFMAQATRRRKSTVVTKLSDWKNRDVQLPTGSSSQVYASLTQDKLALRVDALLSKDDQLNARLRKWRENEMQVKFQQQSVQRALRRLKHMMNETRLLQGKIMKVRIGWLEQYQVAKQSKTMVQTANAHRDYEEGMWAQHATDIRRDYAEAVRSILAEVAAQSEILRSDQYHEKAKNTCSCDCRDVVVDISKTHKQIFTFQRKAIELRTRILQINSDVSSTSQANNIEITSSSPKRKQTVKFDLAVLNDMWDTRAVPYERRINVLFEFLTCDGGDQIKNNTVAYFRSEVDRLQAMHKIQSTPTLLEPLVDTQIVGTSSNSLLRIARLKDMRRQINLGLSRQKYESRLAAQAKIHKDAR